MRERLLETAAPLGPIHQARMNMAGKQPEALALGREPLLEPRLIDGQALHQLAHRELGGFPQRGVVRRACRALYQPGIDPCRSRRPGNRLLARQDRR